jgi:hypothetical protein
MLNTEPQRPLARIVAALAGLAMTCLGVAPLVRRGDMFYTNWFGGLVFVPFAIIFGVFTIGCALFKPHWLAATRKTLRRRRNS